MCPRNRRETCIGRGELGLERRPEGDERRELRTHMLGASGSTRSFVTVCPASPLGRRKPSRRTVAFMIAM
jgi:hypothetical protein